MSDRKTAIRLPIVVLACAILTMGPLFSAGASPEPVAVHTFEELLLGPEIPGWTDGAAFVGDTYPGFWYSAYATCGPSTNSAVSMSCHVIGDANIAAFGEFRTFEATFYTHDSSITSLQIIGRHATGETKTTTCPVAWSQPSHCKLGPAEPFIGVEVRGPYGPNSLTHGFDTAIFTRDPRPIPPPPVDGDVRDLARRPIVLHVS